MKLARVLAAILLLSFSIDMAFADLEAEKKARAAKRSRQIQEYFQKFLDEQITGTVISIERKTSGHWGEMVKEVQMLIRTDEGKMKLVIFGDAKGAVEPKNVSWVKTGDRLKIRAREINGVPHVMEITPIR